MRQLSVLPHGPERVVRSFADRLDHIERQARFHIQNFQPPGPDEIEAATLRSNPEMPFPVFREAEDGGVRRADLVPACCIPVIEAVRGGADPEPSFTVLQQRGDGASAFQCQRPADR